MFVVNQLCTVRAYSWGGHVCSSVSEMRGTVCGNVGFQRAKMFSSRADSAQLCDHENAMPDNRYKNNICIAPVRFVLRGLCD